MTQTLRRNLALLATVLVLAVAGVAWATTIEGYTPAGNFQTVFVSQDGRLFVEIDSSTPQHVTIDGGTVTHVMDPVQVYGVNGAPIPISGTISSTGTFIASPSTAAVAISGQTSVPGSATLIYPADAARIQGCLSNDSSTLNLWVGPAGVSTANGKLIPPLGQLCPDAPGSMQGPIFGASTATVPTSYIYFK